MATRAYPKPTIPAPSQDELDEMLERAVYDTGDAGFETSDGCEVEPDGTCSHGHATWLRLAGLI